MTCTSTCRKPNGNQAHCGATGCHQTFSTVANFDKHRIGGIEERRCADPASVGLRLGADGIWRGKPGTWNPRAQSAEDAQTADPGAVVVVSTLGALSAAKSRTGGLA